MVIKLKSLSVCKKKILFVDPDNSSFHLVSVLLAEHGIETIHSRRGLMAIEVFRKNPHIDCIITEIKVPDLDGFGILREARKINPRIIVIAQTAYVHVGFKQKCYEAGFSEYISKPIHLELFERMIKKHFLQPGRNDCLKN